MITFSRGDILLYAVIGLCALSVIAALVGTMLNDRRRPYSDEDNNG